MSKNRHLHAALVAVLAIVLLGTAGGLPARAEAGPAPATRRSWTGTWEAAASGTVPALPGTSIRNVVHISAGGRAARVRITNRLGTAPLELGAVTVALQENGAPKSPNAVAGTMHTATFRGAASVTVPTGEDVVTDPVPLAVPSGANLLITVYTPTDAGPATYHRSALQTNFLAPTGDHATDDDGSAYTQTTGSWYYVTGVDVLGSRATGSVVTLGDSITDGSGSTSSANRRWPDRLAERLLTQPPNRRLGVLNAGIAGNRVLLEGTGPSALSRLDADVLSRAGVRAMIVMEGINDIKGNPNQTDPAAFEDAYREIVRRAHARGIRVIGATITPYGGNGGYTEARETVRQAVNDFVRTSGLFDALVDFDAVVRDPADPHRILPAYDNGDHLHFNDAGLKAMGDAVDLDHLRRTFANSYAHSAA
ncbi:lysophospholipase L1-like esterase [Streptomyces sp. LBL]|uniref:SGNH/GDSL hydrolase family protein n=1 Tax=Streptomyces sp. LBL TaxID=2940562 RepID=UPI002475BA75|nr:SGNH/GDSL hydrolase family protein [Streptomyces sp. LBL]MDH6626117.1 lysophospholipase L1-like esterase [Streptomyces sp. LBL]